jgi:hypothetical protein
MRLRAELRQRELDADFEQRLERLASEGVVGLGTAEAQAGPAQQALGSTLVRVVET